MSEDNYGSNFDPDQVWERITKLREINPFYKGITVTHEQYEYIQNIVKHMSIEDWKKLRVGDYYKKRDTLRGVAQFEFVVKRVQNYLKNK